MSSINRTQTAPLTGGFVLIHSAPRSLARHLDWVLTRVMGEGQPNEWLSQPAVPDAMRTEFFWQGEHGSGALLASELAGWQQLYFEVTEHAVGGLEGSRWMYTPALGIHRVQMDSVGNAVLNESSIRQAIDSSGPNSFQLTRSLELLMGQPWDDALEPLRVAGEAASTVWLNRVG